MSDFTSLSSICMSQLMAWRNPLGHERTWHMEAQTKKEPSIPFVCRQIVTEIGLALLGTVALVETVACGILAVIDSLVIPSTPISSSIFAYNASSGAFTFVWSAVNALFFNFLPKDLPTDESSARFELGKLHYLLNFVRQSDIQNLANNSSPYFKSYIAEAKDIIKKEIFDTAPLETQKLLLEMDPSAFVFIPNKIVFLFTFGKYKQAPIPIYLKQETQQKITAIRLQYSCSENIFRELTKMFSSIEQYRIDTNEPEIKHIFQAICEAGSEELQGSVGIWKSYQDVIDSYTSK